MSQTRYRSTGSTNNGSPRGVEVNGSGCLIGVYGLTAGYDHSTILKQLSLTVKENKVTVLLGANGAGKSTLLKAIIGAVKPSAGELLYGDLPLLGKTTREILRLGIGYVSQQDKVFPNLTVEENILITASLAQKNPKGLREQLERTLNLFPQLRSKLGSKAGSLSGGEQQLVAISRALLGRPRLLLIDEISIGVAAPILESITERLILSVDRDCTILMAEQNVNWALRVADEAYILKLGEVAAHVTDTGSLSQEELRRAFLT